MMMLTVFGKVAGRFWHYTLAYVLLGIFWRWLEWECYGAPNPNGVDTVIGIITAMSLGENCITRRQRERRDHG